MTTPTSPTPAELAASLRWMRWATRALLTLAAGLLVVGAALWLVQRPWFDIRTLRVDGDLAHVNAPTVRANVLHRLQGNFFTVDLGAARAAFESLPWVRRAVVRRDWPNGLHVQLQAHQAQAYWGADGAERLVNQYGEVFDANTGEVEHEDLPRLNGPIDQSAAVLAFWQALNPVFAPLAERVAVLELNARGAWRAELVGGADLVLGGGSPADVMARVQRFAASVTQASAQMQRGLVHLERADLRHRDGYAMQLAGVRTKPPTP